MILYSVPTARFGWRGVGRYARMRAVMSQHGPKVALLAGLFLMTPSSADIGPVTLDTLEFRTPVLAAYGALQNQPAAAADLGQPYLFGLVVLVAVLAAVFVYWVRHKGLENQIKKLTKLAEDRDVQLHAANQKLKRLAGIDSVTEIANHSHFQEFLRSEWRRALREASSIAVIHGRRRSLEGLQR